jgi:hypothetical protein
MLSVTTNLKLENFDIKNEFQNLINHSQEIIKQYDALLYHLKNLPFDSFDAQGSDLTLTKVFDLIFRSHYMDVEKRKKSISLISNSFEYFNKVYNIENQIQEYNLIEKKLIKECKDIIKQYNFKVKQSKS